MDKGVWQATVHGVSELDMTEVKHSFLFLFIFFIIFTPFLPYILSAFTIIFLLSIICQAIIHLSSYLANYLLFCLYLKYFNKVL